MSENYRIKTYGSYEQAQTGLAIELKRQMNELIDVTYKNKPPQTIRQFKRFTIFCTTDTMKSKHGDCWYNEDKSSSIRILNLAGRNPRDILITTIHELAHHIDFSMRGTSNHDKNFYAVMKQLLCASLDMGILTKDDLVDIDRIEESNARDRGKVGRMMAEYVPHPVAYKQDTTTIVVYNCYNVRERLKNRGYRWNGLDKSWTKEIPICDIESEKEYVLSMGILAEDIKEHSLKGIAIRQRKIARLYNVPFEYRDIAKELGYRWNPSGKQKFWEKRIAEDDISLQEREKLEEIPSIYIKIV